TETQSHFLCVVTKRRTKANMCSVTFMGIQMKFIYRVPFRFFHLWLYCWGRDGLSCHSDIYMLAVALTLLFFLKKCSGVVYFG
uniref:Uncharacterized protein n=1 Tax=Athene cunicularia TaxID=194338 RepID=A0A663MEC0_ATHCN